ncbi:MAG: DNA/RNA non-specific endonuclease [Lentimonas sp.]
MAERKRVAKKKTARKTASKKRAPARMQSNERGFFNRLFRALCIISLIVLIGLAAVYYLSPFSTRNQMHSAAMSAINPMRTADWMPQPVATILHALYDQIPSSEGLIVDGEELGRDNNPILAGIPQSKKPVRILQNTSYTNLFDEKERQTLCVAYHIGKPIGSQGNESDQALKDPRVPNLDADDLKLNEWHPQPIAPSLALSKAFGSNGHNEAMLLTNCAPLTQDFIEQAWEPLTKEVAINYPKRFGKVWIYSGPVYRNARSKLASSLPIPDALYLIAFDITESGGLRAISFLVPTKEYYGKSRTDYLTSIANIEHLTGLRFLPEIGFDSKDVLLSWVSPSLW